VGEVVWPTVEVLGEANPALEEPEAAVRSSRLVARDARDRMSHAGNDDLFAVAYSVDDLGELCLRLGKIEDGGHCGTEWSDLVRR